MSPNNSENRDQILELQESIKSIHAQIKIWDDKINGKEKWKYGANFRKQIQERRDRWSVNIRKIQTKLLLLGASDG